MRSLLGISALLCVVLVDGCTEEGTGGQTADDGSSSSSSGGTSSSSGGGTVGCLPNVTAGTAEPFELGAPSVGTICGGGEGGGYFFFKAPGEFMRGDLFTVHIRLHNAPEANRNVRFGLGSRGEWSQSVWATSTGSAGLHTSHLEDTLTDIPGAVQSDGDTLIFLIASTTIRQGEPPVAFDYTVTRQ